MADLFIVVMAEQFICRFNKIKSDKTKELLSLDLFGFFSLYFFKQKYVFKDTLNWRINNKHKMEVIKCNKIRIHRIYRKVNFLFFKLFLILSLKRKPKTFQVRKKIQLPSHLL